MRSCSSSTLCVELVSRSEKRAEDSLRKWTENESFQLAQLVSDLMLAASIGGRRSRSGSTRHEYIESLRQVAKGISRRNRRFSFPLLRSLLSSLPAPSLVLLGSS